MQPRLPRVAIESARPGAGTHDRGGAPVRLATAALTSLAPATWGTTYIVTTELLPPGKPLLAGALRALPVGLLMLVATRSLPQGSWWWPAGALGALKIGVFFGLLFVTAYPEAGALRAKAARHPSNQGQGCSDGGQAGLGADLRGRLPRLFVRVSSQTLGPPGARRDQARGDAGPALGGRRRHPRLLRRSTRRSLTRCCASGSPTGGC
jgi:hypothetical protein